MSTQPEGKCSSPTTPTWHPDARVKTTFATMALIVSLAVAATVAWTWAQADIREGKQANAMQDRRLDTVEAVQRQQTDLLWEIRGDVKALRAERRTP